MPAFLMAILSPLVLIIMGMVAEKYYTPRLTMFSNAVSLNMYMSISGIGFSYLYGYSNIGLIIGIFALISYVTKSKAGIIGDISLFFSSYLIGAMILGLYFYYELGLPLFIAVSADLIIIWGIYSILPKKKKKSKR